MYKFKWTDDENVWYLEDLDSSTFTGLTDGRATTETTVSLTSVVPPTSQLAHTWVWMGGGTMNIGNADDNLTLGSGSSLLYFVPPAGPSPIVLASNQSFTYRFNSAPAVGSGAYVYVRGYVETR
jgi:hypothetical protein